MDARYCSACGSPLAAGASSCRICGAPVGIAPTGSHGPPAPPGAPLPPPPHDEEYTAAAAPRAPPRTRRLWLIVTVSAVAGLLLLGAVLIYYYPAGYPVEVTQINFVSPDNSCGLDGASDNGFNATTGDALDFSYPIVGNDSLVWAGTMSCTIHNVSTSTSGFGINGADVPLDVPANQTQTLSYVVTCPPSSFDGQLTVVIT